MARPSAYPSLMASPTRSTCGPGSVWGCRSASCSGVSLDVGDEAPDGDVDRDGEPDGDGG
jgi:hypothetical protein